jgi:hypothetical protein
MWDLMAMVFLNVLYLKVVDLCQNIKEKCNNSGIEKVYEKAPDQWYDYEG